MKAPHFARLVFSGVGVALRALLFFVPVIMVLVLILLIVPSAWFAHWYTRKEGRQHSRASARVS